MQKKITLRRYTVARTVRVARRGVRLHIPDARTPCDPRQGFAARQALGKDFKGKISLVIYVAALPLAFVHPAIAAAVRAGGPRSGWPRTGASKICSTQAKACAWPGEDQGARTETGQTLDVVSTASAPERIEIVLGEGIHNVKCELTPTRMGLSYAEA